MTLSELVFLPSLTVNCISYTPSVFAVKIGWVIVESEEKPDLELMVFQDERTYWRENYDVTLKVFDKKI